MRYLFKVFQDKIIKRKIKKEGGELYSLTARKIAESNNVCIDLYSYGSCFSKGFVVSGKCYIGRYCSIASDVHYLGGNHPVDTLSSSAVFYNKNFSGFDVVDIKREVLTIGNDVWIGHGVLITAKCHTIGNGAVIGAGSVVTKDVPPFAIVAGNPARIIRYRFDTETIQKIINTSWWDSSPKELMKYYKFMNNPNVFCEAYKEKQDESLFIQE